MRAAPVRSQAPFQARLARRYRAVAVALGLAIAAPAIYLPTTHEPALPSAAVGAPTAAAISARYQLSTTPATHTGPQWSGDGCRDTRKSSQPC
jgi:hypothetical protein